MQPGREKEDRHNYVFQKKALGNIGQEINNINQIMDGNNETKEKQRGSSGKVESRKEKHKKIKCFKMCYRERCTSKNKIKEDVGVVCKDKLKEKMLDK